MPLLEAIAEEALKNRADALLRCRGETTTDCFRESTQAVVGHGHHRRGAIIKAFATYMVPEAGLEPALPCGKGILSQCGKGCGSTVC